jgi:hypothetical protein
VQRRSDAHRRDATAGASAGDGPSVDLAAFSRREEELASLRAALED